MKNSEKDRPVKKQEPSRHGRKAPVYCKLVCNNHLNLPAPGGTAAQ